LHLCLALPQFGFCLPAFSAKIPTTIDGFTLGTFTEGVQYAYRMAISTKSTINDVKKVQLVNIKMAPARRQLSGRQLASTTIQFDVSLEADDDSAAATLAVDTNAISASDIITEFTKQLNTLKTDGTYTADIPSSYTVPSVTIVQKTPVTKAPAAASSGGGSGSGSSGGGGTSGGATSGGTTSGGSATSGGSGGGGGGGAAIGAIVAVLVVGALGAFVFRKRKFEKAASADPTSEKKAYTATDFVQEGKDGCFGCLSKIAKKKIAQVIPAPDVDATELAVAAQAAPEATV
jgi:hypothetical protein